MATPIPVADGSVPPGSARSEAAAARPDRRLDLRDILTLLVVDGLVLAADAERIAASRTQRFEHPLELIADQRLRSAAPPGKPLHLETLVEWLAGKLHVPYMHVDPLKIDLGAVTATMSNAYAERYRILPVAVDRVALTVATAEPFVRSWADELERILKLQVRLVFANPVDIRRYVGEFYNLARSMKKAQENSKGEFALARNFEQLVELGRHGHLDANDQHVVHIVDWLWQYAFDQRASDIHIEPRRDVGLVRFRIDGVLHQVYAIPTLVLNAVTSRIKLLARMEIVERRRPQDGRIKTVAPDGGEVELRISTMPTAFGEKIVMRIFSPEVLVRDFTDLGFTADDRTRWERMTGEPHGIILVTGPTGSGKTTTLYSTLKGLATPEVNVCTVEDPIEMIEPAFNQMQVQPALGVDFASGVRTLLRQDPDIIMVGEIRDRDTGDMAVQAALTGHLVLSTLHTNDAPSAVTRMLDLGIPAYLINSTLLGVMAQRLVRTLCPHCKKTADPPDDQTWSLMTAPWRGDKPATAMAANGCLECRMTGYLGRIGLYEIMLMTPALRKLITHDADDRVIRDRAFRDGMKPLRVSGAMKVAAGLTTADEVIKVAPLA
ncbi:MAG: type II/IV secretion system protein [Betaproteobacteria bacterium]|nr:GspE/PulE family protein [Betaproteobacteria bacterium]MDE2004040.1 type II/IV secretion system protein [Betaproteobacteria bacterium]